MYKYEKYISKEHLRYVFYAIAVLFIVYFIWDTSKLCQDLDKPLLKTQNELNNINGFNISYKSSETTYFTNTQGQILWSVFINIMQIIFLVMFMVMLYINELLEKWNLKK